MNELPEEILRMIFGLLDRLSAVRCRVVCRRWLQVIDALPDNDWKRIWKRCRYLHNYILRDDYEAVHQRYGLSWRDTFKAIHSWSMIEYSDMTPHELCDHEVEKFKVLPNGLLAVLKNKRHEFHSEYRNTSDTIVYYKVDEQPYKQCGEVEFPFPFFSEYYDENEYFIVLVQTDGTLCLVLKENKRIFNVGKMDLNSDYNSLTLIGKELYFQDWLHVLYVSKLQTEDGESTVVTEPLDNNLDYHFEEDVVAFSMVGRELFILSVDPNDDDEFDGTLGNVYDHNGRRMRIGFDTPGYRYDDLKLWFGFDWRSNSVYRWHKSRDDVFATQDDIVFYSHGLVYLISKYDGRVVYCCYLPHWISNASDMEKVLKRKCSKVGIKKIYMKNLLPGRDSAVSQLDIIETSTNPKILVLVDNRMFVIEVIFNAPPDKRQLRSSQLAESKTKKRKLQSKDKVENKTVKRLRRSRRIKNKMSANTKRKGVQQKKKTARATKKKPIKSTRPKKSTYKSETKKLVERN